LQYVNGREFLISIVEKISNFQGIRSLGNFAEQLSTIQKVTVGTAGVLSFVVVGAMFGLVGVSLILITAFWNNLFYDYRFHTLHGRYCNGNFRNYGFCYDGERMKKIEVKEAQTLNLLVLIICLNTFMFIGVKYTMSGDGSIENNTDSWISNDLFDIMLKNSDGFESSMDSYAANPQGNLTNSYVFDLNGNFSNPPDLEAGTSVDTDSGGFSLVDTVRICFLLFIITLFKIAIMPIILFTSNTLPPLISLIIALPLSILYITCLVIFLKGGGAP